MKIFRLKNLAESFGRSISNVLKTKDGINQIRFEKNRKFDYEGYKRIQIEGNKEKLDEVFEIEENIEMLSTFLKKNLSNINFGICHGTRRGKEQEWFRKYLNVDVIGTEISDTANQFPNTIQWDFHKVKDEWVENVDFIYSNSLDHSYDAEFCLKQWFKCLRKGGICIVNGSMANLPYFANKLDPLGFTKKGLLNLINKLADECNVKIDSVLQGKPNPKKPYKGWYYYIVRKI